MSTVTTDVCVDYMGYLLDGPNLQPCPHCGSPAKIIYNDHGNNEFVARCLKSMTCGARMGAWSTAAEAATVWNRRAP